MRSPSRKPAIAPIVAPAPSTVRASLSQRLYVAKVQALLREYKSCLAIEDLRTSGAPLEAPLEAHFVGELTDAQRQAANAIAEHDNGVIVAPPGFGKTVLGTYLIAERQCSTLVLVHRQPLVNQWRSQISAFLDCEPKSIGQLSGGKRRLTGIIDVAMIQSLSRKGSVDDMVADYGLFNQRAIQELSHSLQPEKRCGETRP